MTWTGITLPSAGGGDPELIEALQAQVADLQDTIDQQTDDLADLAAELATAEPKAHVYALADAVAQGDPSLTTSTAAVANGTDNENVRITLRTPNGGAAAATLPGASTVGGSWVQWLCKDIFGETITIDRSDIADLQVWMNNAIGRLPTDTYVAVFLTAGGVGDIGNGGVGVGLRYAASGNEAFVTGNAGAGSGWVTPLAASAVDPHTIGAKYKVLRNNGSASVFRNVIAIDAAGEESSATNTSPIAPSGNTYTDAPMTHVSLVVGWSGSGGGTSPVVIDASVRSIFGKWVQYKRSQPRITPATPALPSIPSKWLIIGDSNGNGTQVDGTKGGVSVPAGFTYRNAGANASTWASGSNPGVGVTAYLVDVSIALGATGGYVIRRATNGADTSWPGTITSQTSGAIDDVVALGQGDPDVIVFFWGANDSNDSVEAAAYLRNMRREIRILRHRFPLARLVIVRERMLDSGVYPATTTIYGHQDTLAAEFPATGIADGTAGTPVPNFDQVHFLAGPTGYGVLATRIKVAAGYP